MTSHEQYRDDLPLLAADVLTPAEAAELQRHVAQCAECREELAQLTYAVSQTAIAQSPVAPPPYLRSRILDQVSARRRPQAAKEKKYAWSFWTWVPVAASLIFAVLSFVFWREGRALEQENRTLAGTLRDDTATLKRSRALLATLTAADALHVTLTAAGKAAPPEAKTIYSARQHALVLTASNLAPLAPNKAYQLWLLPQDGSKPVPYGTFKPDAHGNAVLVMTALEKNAPKAFAVTVEPEAGSPAPTSAIVLVGSV